MNRIKCFFWIKNFLLKRIRVVETKIKEEINSLAKMIKMGLKSISRCFVSTKDAPQKSIAKKREM
jgi:hypothetical protein